MPNFAIIEKNKVINTVVAETDYALTQGWIALPDNAGIDWDYINGQFFDNRPIPKVVTPSAPTKEELLAQVQALTEQIQALN
jgi:hypothetical protein